MEAVTRLFSQPESRRRWVALGLAVLILGLTVQYTIKSSEDRSAFVRWRNQIQDLGEGKNIYKLHNYPNAPMMALLLYPLSFIPKTTVFSFDVDFGALTWFFLKIGMALAAFVMVFKLVQQAELPFPPWAQAVTVLLSLRPIVGDLTHGNVNLLILFLVVAALYTFKRGWQGPAGLILALAITCKVTPALFLPYFLWKRAWRSAAGCVVGLVLFFFVVPGALLGPSHNWKLLSSWTQNMILPFVAGGEVTTKHNNQSLPGMVYRLGTHSRSFDEDEQPAGYHNLVNLNATAAGWIAKGCGIAFLILMCWSCRTSLENRDTWKLAAEFSIVILGMLLFSERTWKHHCVTLLVPFAVLCYYVAALRPGFWWHGYLIGSLAAATVAMTTTSTTFWELFGDRMGAKLAQVYGAYVWAELILLAALVVILAKHRRQDRQSPVEKGTRVEVYRANVESPTLGREPRASAVPLP